MGPVCYSSLLVEGGGGAGLSGGGPASVKDSQPEAFRVALARG